MMKKSKPIIKIKPKPKKPTPKRITKTLKSSRIAQPWTLKKVKDEFKGANLKDIKFTLSSSFYDGTVIEFTAYIPESDESLGKRMKVYEARLKTWKKWQKENKELIAQEVQRQRKELQDKQKEEMSELNAQLEFIE